MDRTLGDEAHRDVPAGPEVAAPEETARYVAAGPPAPGGVFDPGVGDTAPLGDAERDRVGLIATR